MCASTIYGSYANGMVNKEEYPNFISAFIIAIVVDYIILDTLIVIYAFYVQESPLLQFLGFRGFFIYLHPEKIYLALNENDDKKN